jgi:hypothetical protein
MSKQTSRLVALIAVLILGITAVTATQFARVSTPQRATVASSTTRNAAIVAATTEVLKETSEIRELPILRPVKSGAQSRTEIERMLIKNLNEQTSPAEMHATEVSFRKFGLAPSDFQYRPFIIKLLTEQVAGYYDPKVREFHLADWLELEGQKPVMAHELTHALQDQHFNLQRFEKWPQGDSDAELAVHALIEGDATLAMTLYMAKHPLVALAFSRSLVTGVATEQFNQAPRAMRESLIFPYMQGMEWTTQLYRRGGWTMVSNAFTKLPLSTEQILHPEKYFNYERPVKISLPDVSSVLNANNPAVSDQPAAVSSQQPVISVQQPDRTAGVWPGSVRGRILRRRSTAGRKLPAAHGPLPTPAWHRIDADVNGEWTYYLILDQFLNAPAESKRAAAGWAGDRYAIYEGPEGQVLLTQVAVWDTENDAREFFDAYVKRTELRYPGAKQLDSFALDSKSQNSKLETRNPKLETSNSESETRNIYSWETSEGRVIVELRGLRVVILEGVPGGVNANALVKGFWQ